MRQGEMRREVVIIVGVINGIKSLHFCGTRLQGNDVWYPVGESLFVTVERLMVCNDIAHNVTSVSAIRDCGKSTDYMVRFNKGVRYEETRVDTEVLPCGKVMVTI